MNFVDKLSNYIEIYFEPIYWKKKIRKLFVILFPISFPIWLASILPIFLILVMLWTFGGMIDWTKDLWRD